MMKSHKGLLDLEDAQILPLELASKLLGSLQQKTR